MTIAPLKSCNATASAWTFRLRQGVTFHNGATFDANDVVTSYAAMWDTENPLHVGNTGQYSYWGGLWGDWLNSEGGGGGH